MRFLVLASLAVGVAGCPVESLPCREFDEVFVWMDEDGDGFGGETALGYVCTPRDNEATNNVDCDDTQPSVNPGIAEACDLIDNDCDGSVDESLPFFPWYLDSDNDGYGDPLQKQTFCLSPGEEWTQTSGDCNDADPLINPVALEVCDGGIDNDCDGGADDLDGGLDLSTATRWYIDGDADGYGGDTYFDQCITPNPEAVTVGGDCADGVPSVNPGVLELCGPTIDENCNGLFDDEDPYIDPGTQLEFFADADGDGFGDKAVITLACAPTPGIGVDNDLDCDDTDFGANIVQGWFADTDGDGVGAGALIATQCLRPAGDVEPESAGIDCMPDDPAIYPGAFDPCVDGIDSDCDLLDTCRSCKHWQDTLGLGALDGVYDIEPQAGDLAKVWCDQTTDDGGWTLVLSTRNEPPNDAGTPAAVLDLQTLDPAQEHATVWMGMRRVVQAEGDIRFACSLAGSSAFDVDLSFYDNLWYMEITTGTDSQSCFNEDDGNGADPPPARRNNVSGSYLPAGDLWNAGFLEGEDTCSDLSDFAIDFDDRGMAGNPNDGSDWGESDTTNRCTGNNLGAEWFIFAREN